MKEAVSVKMLSNPKLCSLSPTAVALDLDIKRAHYQTIIWKCCLQSGLPPLDPCKVHVLAYTFKILQN